MARKKIVTIEFLLAMPISPLYSIFSGFHSPKIDGAQAKRLELKIRYYFWLCLVLLSIRFLFFAPFLHIFFFFFSLKNKTEHNEVTSRRRTSNRRHIKFLVVMSTWTSNVHTDTHTHTHLLFEKHYNMKDAGRWHTNVSNSKRQNVFLYILCRAVKCMWLSNGKWWRLEVKVVCKMPAAKIKGNLQIFKMYRQK